MRRLTIIFLPLLGLIAGFGLSQWWQQRIAPVPTAIDATTPETAAAAPTEAPPPHTAVVTIRATHERAAATTSAGIVVGRNDFVVADAAAIAGANRVTIDTGGGVRTEANLTWGSDELYGLVALRPDRPLEGVAVLEPAAGAGSLQPGTRVAVLTPDGAQRGAITSPARRDVDGAWFYELSRRAADGTVMSALTDLYGERLLGLAMPREASQPAVAIDAEPIATLYRLSNEATTLSLDAFSERFFATSGRGRLLQLDAMLAEQRYTEALEYAQRIINLDERAQRDVPPPARRALRARAEELVEDGRLEQALALLDDAALWLQPDTALLAQRAWLLETLGRDTQAFEALLAMGETDGARMLVLSQALTGSQDATTVALLEHAAELDPEFPTYQRLLGEHYARSGDVRTAVGRLTRAIELDPSLERDLRPLIDRLLARRHTPALAEIPITRTGGTMFVETRINGHPQTLRFMVDTGASYTALSREAASRLGLWETCNGGSYRQLETANGRVVARQCLLDSVQIGTARIDNVDAVILQRMGNIDGLLGQSFLSHFDIEIDRTRGVIALHRRPGP